MGSIADKYCLQLLDIFRKKESFFETRPRLVRRNTLLVRDGVDGSSAGVAEFGEIQSVSVVGKGYSDDIPSGQSSQPSKAGRDRRRLLKGVPIVFCEVFVLKSVFHLKYLVHYSAYLMFYF